VIKKKEKIKVHHEIKKIKVQTIEAAKVILNNE
jgi:hypothetical protein